LLCPEAIANKDSVLHTRSSS